MSFLSLLVLCLFLHCSFAVFSLDIQATKSLDRQMETSRQVMFVTAFEHILKNLRNKRDISEDQMKVVCSRTEMEFALKTTLYKSYIVTPEFVYT